MILSILLGVLVFGGVFIYILSCIDVKNDDIYTTMAVACMFILCIMCGIGYFSEIYFTQKELDKEYGVQLTVKFCSGERECCSQY